jgi:aminopeptidase N
MANLRNLLLLLTFVPVVLFAQIDIKGSQYCFTNKIKKDITPELQITSPPPTHSFDVLDYNLDLDIYNCFLSPYPKSFTGKEIITLRADSTLNQIKLDAYNSSLIIDGVGLAGTSFTHSSNVLTINLNRTYSPGELIQVLINYRHQNVSDGAFYVSNGFVFTDCEPEGARRWFPCWDKPYDKATLNLRAKTPSNVKLGSNGRLADSVKTGDTIYYNWISRDPIATYLIVISARVNYNLDIIYWTKPSTQEIIPIRFYYNPGESVTSIKPKVLQMMNRYSELFGEHPFEKNGFATLNSQFSWGGMENQTLTSLCPNCWSENLISHEFAHQWFGDMITCATWADIWLNEGFATYCEALWYEYTGGYSSYKNDIISDANSYFSGNPGWAISNPQWAVVTPDVNTLFNYSITYAKGACVLHMLRYVLGDSTFFRALKAYGTDTVRFKFKSATIRDFQNLVSEIANQDMSWFFDEWIYTPNHPVYQNTYSISSAGNGNWIVAFTAKQTQTNTGFFKMPLTLKITFASGPDTLIRVFNSVNNQTFSFMFNRQPTSLVFDPNNDIVLKQGTTTQTTTNCREVVVNEGWNIVSVPLNSNNFNPTILFPTAVSPAYGYSNGYYVSDSLLIGKGYWLKFSTNQSIPLCGNLSSTNSIGLKAGWNMIGVLHYDVNVNNITSNPPQILVTPFYGFNNGYQQENLLKVGKGYWVKASQDGIITFNTQSKSSDVVNEYFNEAEFIKIKISDSKNYHGELFLTRKNIELDKFELPPLPPSGIPDARFLDDKFINQVDKANYIQLQSLSYPIEIQIEGLNSEAVISISDLADLSFGEFILKDKIKIEKPVELLKINYQQIPEKFQVYQNFPNPFNSETNLRFELPVKGDVKFSIYNLLGEKVKEVILKDLPSGAHLRRIDFSGLSTGIYFIKSEFRENVKTIKAIYIK